MAKSDLKGTGLVYGYERADDKSIEDGGVGIGGGLQDFQAVF